MILVTADIWTMSVTGKHAGLSAKVSELVRLGEVLGHQFVLGDLMLGVTAFACKPVIDRYPDLEQAEILPFEAVAAFVKTHGLSGKGLHWDDAGLLASVASARARIWTTVGALGTAAAELGLAYEASK